MNKYQELLQTLEKEHQITCKAADIEETARAKVYFQLLRNLTDKETQKKPVEIQDDVFGDYHLVCPNCKHNVYDILKRYDYYNCVHCQLCGQAIENDGTTDQSICGKEIID